MLEHVGSMTDPSESRLSWLLPKLSGVGSDIDANESQLDYVKRFLDHYRHAGVVEEDEARPLYDACAACARCWGSVPLDERPAPVDATVSVPWVGSNYGPGGVAAVAINMNKYGGLGAQWWLRNGANRSLREGRREPFSYPVGTYLALALASLAGLPLDRDPPPSLVAEAWDHSAFLEAVKCAPMRGVGEPTREMWGECPTRYLAGELELLAPGVVVTVGRRVADAIAAATSVTWELDESGFRRGRGHIGNAEVEVLGCNHPSWRHWRTTLPALVTSLSREPLSRARGRRSFT